MSIKLGVLFLVLLLALLIAVDRVFFHLSFAEPLVKGDLSGFQAKQVDIYVQVTQQILTLATLLLAGVGLFITPARKILVALFAVFSMSFGYLSLSETSWMLSKHFFNLETPVLHYLRLGQFWTFVVSVLLFAWFWLTQSTPEQSK